MVHNPMHWGVQRTTEVVRKVFNWLNWRKDVSVFVTECAVCLHRENINLKDTLHYENHAFNVNEVLCMDLVGLLPLSKIKINFVVFHESIF